MAGSGTSAAHPRAAISPDRGQRSTPPEIVVRLGDADLAHALQQLRAGLPLLLTRGQGTVVIDLSGTTQLSSATLAAMLWIRRRCRSHGVLVVLSHPSRRSLEMLRRVGLESAFPVEHPHEVHVAGWPTDVPHHGTGR